MIAASNTNNDFHNDASGATTAQPPRMSFLETTQYDVVVKAVIIGDSGVGKTSLLHRFSSSEWNPHYIATIGVDFKALTIERNAKIVKVQLWDTAGQERFRTITHAYYRGAHCVLMVYDVTNRESLEHLQFWMKDVQRYANSGTPMVLVGNKSDMVRHRVVPPEEGRAVADAMGCAAYIETSAKDSDRVDEAFDSAIGECMKQHAKIYDRLRGASANGGSRGIPIPKGQGESVMGPKSRCACN